MAFDLVVGTSSKYKGASAFVGSIEFNELPAISRLIARVDSFFLHRISIFFVDQSFSPEEVDQALTHLLPLLTSGQLHPDERSMLHKLVAALSYARWKQQPLHGIAD
ncbi:hypothetical protein GCM10007907_03850 [Chitinimonas prasina]|uniref:Uncharacterized protein n=1 Tax=Chitinimonas prasina TaxID=1434937 RepID=A0ABQ5Y9H3_9NEIS|nr:hypothetical protein [Chitinimonas prasina]GLR11595.1 hypothetical protein GCM10007907_03850 [Chitinimonas prasina]